MMQEDLSDTESRGINGSQMMEMQSTEPHKKVGPSQEFKKKVASDDFLTLSFYLGLRRFLFYLYQIKYQSFTAFGDYAEQFFLLGKHTLQ
jgi:hypothetical protein